jgi:DNA-binding GntR family transcriptional regulator
MGENKDKTADRITEAYKEIRKLILFHRLSPGTPIIQARMADDLGHSRATLRAALQRLAQEGYVVETELGTYSRFVVASLTVEDMQELFAIVGALEGVAIRQVAALPPEEREELARRMEGLNARVLRMVEDGGVDPDEANRSDTAFHSAFINMATGSRLLTQLRSIRPQVDRYRDLYLVRVAGQMRVLGAPEHQAIVDAIRCGDPERAQKAVEDHWRAGAGRLQEFIQEMGEHRGYAGD